MDPNITCLLSMAQAPAECRSSKTKRGNRGRREANPQVDLSKRLSWLLRHGASGEGIHMTASGFVKVSDLLRLRQFKGYTVDDVRKVVEENMKQRFELEGDLETGELIIRANQGHSIDVPDLELMELRPGDVSVAYHGTFQRVLPEIQRQGLSRMTRQHIHMTERLPGSGNVISGMRQNCNAVIQIDVTQAVSDGIKFYKSKNGVILSPGNQYGYIESKYFIEIIER